MTTNPAGPASPRRVSGHAVGGTSVFASGTNSPESLGKERLKALLCELDGGDKRWTEHVVAMIEEDYNQLMKDFGLR